VSIVFLVIHNLGVIWGEREGLGCGMWNVSCEMWIVRYVLMDGCNLGRMWV
jgi:hypothetical protein